MMNNSKFNQLEATRKKKSLRITMFIHAIVFSLAFLPFLSTVQDLIESPAVMITFESAGSSEAGAKKSARKKAPKKVFTPKEAAAPKVVEVKPLPTAPIKTSPSDAPAIPEIKEVKVDKPKELPKELPKKVETPKVVKKTPADIPVKEVNVEEVESEAPDVAEVESDDNGSGDSDSGDASTDGDGTGNADAGDGADDIGDGGKGSGDGMFEGDGVLTRKIIERPNLNEIVAQKGKISINVCVNKKGRVTFAEYNKEHSTIDDLDVVRKALKASSEYLFEKKYNGANRECGRLTFIIDFIDNRKPEEK